jgi:hypothetical protein
MTVSNWITVAIPTCLLLGVGVWFRVVIWPNRQWHRYGDTPPKDRP